MATTTAVSAVLATSQQIITVPTNGGPGSYYGFSLRETSGTDVATVRIYDHGSADSGTMLDSVQLAAGESAREWYGPQGVQYHKGIRVDVVAGAVEGSIRHG